MTPSTVETFADKIVSFKMTNIDKGKESEILNWKQNSGNSASATILALFSEHFID